MYGWRARIGHVAPSRGDTLLYEFYKMFPEGFKPAVTSSLACIWYAMKLIDIKERVVGCGRLMASLGI